MSIFCLFLIVCMVIPTSIANIIMYPLARNVSVRISDYIIKVLAPMIYSILRTYGKFHFWGYDETKKDLPEQFLVICNHQSLLDIPTLMKFFHEKDPRFVAKDALARHVPLVSEMLRSQQHCTIPRKAKPMEAMKYLEKFGKRVAERNQIPIIFPEGTRSKDGQLNKFYSAGFRKLADSSQLPVVACVLDGGYKLRGIKDMKSNFKNGCYRVKVLKVFNAPKDKDECSQILEEAKVLMNQQLEEWRKIPDAKKY